MKPRQTRPRLVQAMIDAFRMPDLRRRILITFGMLVAFRFIAHIPLPGVDPTTLKTYSIATLCLVCWICSAAAR